MDQYRYITLQLNSVSHEIGLVFWAESPVLIARDFGEGYFMKWQNEDHR